MKYTLTTTGGVNLFSSYTDTYSGMLMHAFDSPNKFINLHLGNKGIEGVNFDKCYSLCSANATNSIFKDCIMRGMSRTNMNSSTFINCDFSGVVLVNCGLSGTSFINCNLQGMDFIGCKASHDTSFEGCSGVVQKTYSTGFIIGIERIAPKVVYYMLKGKELGHKIPTGVYPKQAEIHSLVKEINDILI